MTNPPSASRFSIRSGIEERQIEMRAFPLPSHDLAAVALFIDVTHVERLEELGHALVLPPWLEPRRRELVENLPTLNILEAQHA